MIYVNFFKQLENIYFVRKKVMDLHAEWTKLNNNKKQTSAAAEEKRSNFQTEIKNLLWIGIKELVNFINSDRLRSPEAKEEDKMFIEDQIDPLQRKMHLGNNDVKYESAVERKVKRDLGPINVGAGPSKPRESSTYPDNESSEDDSNANDPECRDRMSESIHDKRKDPDFVDQQPKPGVKRTKKPATVTLEVPTNILEVTAMSNARYGIGARAHAMTTADFIQKSGGDIKNFTLSKSQANRNRKKVVSKQADETKELFRNKLQSLGKTCILHFDGKSVVDYTNGVKSTNERMAVVLSSPNLEEPQVLEVPVIQSGKGDDIVEGVMSVL